MRAAFAIVVLVTGCHRLLALEHIDPVDAAFVACPDHDFCDNFDREQGVDLPWDNRVELSGSIMLLSPDASVSPPNSLLVSLPNPAGDAYLEKQLPRAAAMLVVEAAVSLDVYDSTAEVDLIALEWGVVSPPCSRVALIVVTTGNPRVLMLQETYLGCGGLVRTVLTAHEPGFRRITMTVALGPPTTVAIAINGAAAFDRQVIVDLQRSTTRLRIGAPFVGNNQSAPWQLRFDDVIADID